MPLGRIKIIRRNGTSDFSDNSNISVSEYLGTVTAPGKRPDQIQRNFYQNHRNQR